MTKGLVALFFYIAVLTPNFVSAEFSDRIVAVVNDEVITLSELDEEGASLANRMKNTETAARDASSREAQSEVLSQLIDQKLVTQKAQALGIIVTDAEVDQAIEQILQKNRMDQERFNKELAGIGKTFAGYREMIKSQIQQSKVISVAVRAKVVIPESKSRMFYERHYNKESLPEGYHVLQIGSSWDPAGGEEAQKAAKARILETRRLLVEEKRDFRELASVRSDLPSARDGGDLGSMRRDEMAEYMRDVVCSMPPGGVSNVVETPSGFQIFKLVSFRDGDVVAPPPFEAVRGEIEDGLYQEELQQQFAKWVNEMRTTAYIKILL